MLTIVNLLHPSEIGYIFTGLGIGITIGYFARSFIIRRLSAATASNQTMTTVVETHDSSLTGNPEYKMVLVVRNDLKMGKGKACAQCSHAAVLAYSQARKFNSILKKWMECGQRKVVLKVENEQDLIEVARNAKQAGLINVVIQDAGRTQVSPGTRTVCGIGPARGDLIDKVTGHLKLY